MGSVANAMGGGPREINVQNVLDAWTGMILLLGAFVLGILGVVYRKSRELTVFDLGREFATDPERDLFGENGVHETCRRLSVWARMGLSRGIAAGITDAFCSTGKGNPRREQALHAAALYISQASDPQKSGTELAAVLKKNLELPPGADVRDWAASYLARAVEEVNVLSEGDDKADGPEA